MSVNLVVLYPQPTDIAAFESDYEGHLALWHEKAGIPKDQTPYTILRFAPGPDGPAPYYQMVTMPFPSAEALEEAMSTPLMEELGADAVRISTGGPPLILVGA
mgnify:CR=1 FL=1